MSEQVLLSSIALDGVREQGGFGQPLHTLYQQLRLILSIELGEEYAALLAEPVVDRVRNRIDWYTQGDAEQTPQPLDTLPEAQRAALLAQVEEQLAQGRALAERYLASGNAQRMQLGAALNAVLQPLVDASQVILLGERPLLIYWGFVTDRPWCVLPSTVARVPLAAPALDTTAPAITQPVQAAPAADTTAPLAVAPVVPLTVPLSGASAPSDTPATLAIPAAPAPTTRNEQRPMLQSSRSSRYFWLALLLVLLMALAAFFWDRAGKPLPWATTQPASTLPATALPNQEPPARLTPTQAEKKPAALAAAERDLAPATAGAVKTKTPPAAATLPASATAANTPLPDTAVPPSTLENALLATNAAPQKNPPAANAAQQQPASTQTTEQTTEQTVQRSTLSVEQVLESGAAKPSAKVPAPPPPAVPVEPTAEERREFAERLSASGAASGAISASLLWDGNADLDLVVTCPTGQSVDYQNPNGCAGKLDVDANALRDQLKDKPVENIFWAAGAAAPGVYEIAVRYKPRKDERQPQPIPFQVRLNHDQQEQVFKGSAQPGKLVTVTTFTVPEP